MCPACPCIYRTVARQYIARMRPLPVSTSAREPCDCRSERAVASAPSVQLSRIEPHPLSRCSLLLNPTPTRPNLARDLAVLSIAGVPSPPAPNHASPPPARRIGGSGKYCAARRVRCGVRRGVRRQHRATVARATAACVRADGAPCPEADPCKRGRLVAALSGWRTVVRFIPFHAAHSSLTGMKRKATASDEPTSAIQTTETAAGTRTMNCAKCSFARRKPKADDFIEVSIATVRQTVSE